MRFTLLVLAGLALIALLVPDTRAAKGGKPRPPPVPADPVIAYVDDGSNLTVMNADGSNGTVIHTGDSRLYRPSWSPDGKHLAFQQGISIWRIDVALADGVPVGTNATKLLDDAFGPCWSPAGDEIVYSTDGSGVAGRGGSLHVIPATGGTPTTLYTAPDNEGVGEPAWSPDAGKIAFVAPVFPGGAQEIRVLDIDTGAVTTHLSLPPTFIPRLDWGRTTDVLVYEIKSYGKNGRASSAIHTLDLSDDTTTEVCDGGDPCWSPDDSKVLYSDGSIHVRDLATGVTEKLARDGRWPDWLR